MASAIVAGMLFVSALYGSFSAFQSSQGVAARSRESLVAHAFASELLEYFISQSSDRFQAAWVAGASTSGLTLCSYNNTVNRASGVKVNAVPEFDLPAINFLNAPDTVANRYVRIDVVNVGTLAVRQNVCARRLSEVYLPGRPPGAATVALAAGETFKITVGVEWRTKKGRELLRLEQSSTSQNL